ncbi:MAG: hypothetical protein KZQ94_10455 [Candidatus Thiodiazotropha sp. (ex Troendleina suluensis)]|nr:hypothetical protein [Candidatus Thiodiazotropha sp. (ex Troendleina suluensis)]
MITLDGITLPGDLEWIDEHTWSSVGQTKTVTLTGALIIEEAAQLAGQPITLVGGQRACLVTKATVESLQALADQAGLQMSLDYNGTVMAVMFNRENGEAAEARLFRRIADPQPTDLFYITIRLMRI